MNRKFTVFPNESKITPKIGIDFLKKIALDFSKTFYVHLSLSSLNRNLGLLITKNVSVFKHLEYVCF